MIIIIRVGSVRCVLHARMWAVMVVYVCGLWSVIATLPEMHKTTINIKIDCGIQIIIVIFIM